MLFLTGKILDVAHSVRKLGPKFYSALQYFQTRKQSDTNIPTEHTYKKLEGSESTQLNHA